MKRGFLPGHLMFVIIKIIMTIIPKQLSLQEGKSFALAQHSKHRMPIVPYPDQYSWETMQSLRMTMSPQATAGRDSYEDQGTVPSSKQRHGHDLGLTKLPNAENRIPHPTSPDPAPQHILNPELLQAPPDLFNPPRGGRKERRRKCPPPPTSLPWALPSPPSSFSGASLPLRPPHSPAIFPGCTTSGYVS